MSIASIGLFFYVILLWAGLTWKTPGSIEHQGIALLALATFFVLIIRINRKHPHQKEI